MGIENAERTIEILLSAERPAPHPELERILTQFAADFRAIARARYSGPGADIEDAVQATLIAITSRRNLERLQEPRALGAWARAILCNELYDAASRAHPAREVLVGRPDDDPEEVLAMLAVDEETPEDAAAAAERLGLIRDFLRTHEIARLRWLHDLSEREIGERMDLTRDQVAGRLKRLRKLLKRLLEGRE